MNKNGSASLNEAEPFFLQPAQKGQQPVDREIS